MQNQKEILNRKDIYFLHFSNAFFCSVTAVVCAIFYCILQTGFEDSANLLFPTLGCSLFILNSPIFIINLLKDRYYSLYGYEAALHIGAVFLLLLGSKLDVELLPYLSSVGFIFFAYTSFYLSVNQLTDTIKLVLVSFLFALLCAAKNWSYYQDPLFIESLAFDAKAYCCRMLDPLFQISVSQMIKTYGVTSTGLDGIPLMNYHAGSNWLMAEISTLLNTHVMDVYHYVYPVFFIPLFIKLLLTLTTQIQEVNLLTIKFDIMIYCYMTVIIMGFFHFEMKSVRLSKYVAGTLQIFPTHLVSESYLISLIILFISFSILIKLYTTKRYIIIACILPVLILLTSYSKISTGYIFIGILFYFFLRLNLYKRIYILISVLLSILVFFIMYNFVVDKKSAEGAVSFFHYYNENNIFILPFIVIYFLPSFCAILLSVFFIKKNSGLTIKQLIVQRKTLMPEVLSIIICLGLLPTFVLEFSSQNSLYFTDITFWIAIIFFLTFSPFYLTKKFKKERQSKFITAIFSILMAYFLYSYIISVKRFANLSMNVNNLRVRKLIVNDTVTTSLLKETENYFRKEDRREYLDFLYGNRISEKAYANDFYMFMKELKKLDTLSIKVKSHSLLYYDHTTLPQLHDLFCYQAPLILTSLSGMAMIEGYPPAGCVKDGYGFEYYKNESKQNIKSTLYELCKKVRLKGFYNLYHYDELSRKWICEQC